MHRKWLCTALVACAALATAGGAGTREGGDDPGASDPAAWIDALAGERRGEAFAALLALGPEQAAPPLVACVRAAPADHAFQAARALGLLAEQERGRHHRLSAAAAELARLAGDAAGEPGRRRIAVLALAHLGPHARGTLKSLVALVADDAAPPDLRLHAALAAASGGQETARMLQAELRRPKTASGVLALSALAALGPEGSAARKTVLKLAQDEKELAAFLLARASEACLVQMGAQDEAREARLTRLRNPFGGHWSNGKVNLGGILSREMQPHHGVLALCEMVQIEPPPEATTPGAIALPPGFDPLGPQDHRRAGEVLQVFLGHVVLETAQLRPELAGDRFGTWTEWEARAQPLVNLVTLLTRLAVAMDT